MPTPATPKRDEPGQLWTGSAGGSRHGRIIDRWTFDAALVKDAQIKIEVILRQGPEGLIFDAKSPSLPNGCLSDSDIEGLRQRTMAALREEAALRTGIVWEDWLEVRVAGHEPFGRRRVNGSELRIEYSVLRRGRHADHPERDFTLSDQGHAIPFPKPKHAGDRSEAREVELGAERVRIDSGRDPDSEYAYLPDTAANRAALDHLIDSLQRLRTQLSDFLAQDNIAHAVTVVATQQWPQLDGPGTRRSPKP